MRFILETALLQTENWDYGNDYKPNNDAEIMSTTRSNDSAPSDGERNALVGFSAQFKLAARVVQRHLPLLEWIRVADPDAGVADDFQFLASGRRHALQVKWSQFPGSFTWSDFAGSSGQKPSLLWELADAWKRLRLEWDGSLTVHLCTNNFPSTAKPPTGSALASLSGAPRHFAAFITRALVPLATVLRKNPDHHWSDVIDLELVRSWADGWNELIKVSGLTESEFTNFLRDFEFTFVQLDHSELVSTRDSTDVTHLASVLQSLVVDSARLVELTRTDLMLRLGWTERIKYRNPHWFPVPATYTANGAARAALEQALEHNTNGYLALIGPAGSGKSTLVESTVIPGRLVRYYAFVPDSPDPLSGRGEAQSFMHDLSLALEEAGIYREGFGNDLLGQREVLFDQLSRAGERFSKDGVRTTIVVDGLDHIPREQNPTRSLLDELPPPSALPDGVCILIGSQTMSILPPLIREVLKVPERVVDVPPLAHGEIEEIVTLAGVSAWLAPGQLRTLVDKSEGHPLVLTYMLQDLRSLESADDVETRQKQAEQMLSEASDYRGSIDLRYTHYLGSLLDDREVLDVLGAVCRLRIPVDLRWLESWIDPAAVSRFAERTHTFFRRDGNEWTFIHNSFRRFLVEQTAMVGGELRTWRSRELHEQLAVQCAASTGWPRYQDEELAQRYLAGQHQLVLEAAVPKKLRQSLLDGRPYGVVRDQTIVAIRASVEACDYRGMIRSLMFLNELHQRGYVLHSADIASAMTEIDPGRAIEHAVQGRSLRIEVEPALRIAADLAAENYLENAETIIRAIGGLQGLVGERNYRQRGWVESIADWAETTWHRSGVGRVLDELDHLLPLPAHQIEPYEDAPAVSAEGEGLKAGREARESSEDRERIIDARNAVHARCFDLADDIRDQATCSLIASRIDAESNLLWRARKHVIAARSAQVDGETAEVLRQIQMMLDLEAWQGADSSVTASANSEAENLENDEEEVHPQPKRILLSLRVSSADVLARAGLAESKEFLSLLPPETKVSWPTSVASTEGMAPFETMLGVFRMRALAQRIQVYRIPPVDDLMALGVGHEPARNRFLTAITSVAEMEAQAIASTLGEADVPDVPALVEPVIRLLDVPYQTTRDWSGWYRIVAAAPDLYVRLINLAYECGGYGQLDRLLSKFKSAWDSPERRIYWSIERRIGVIRAAASFAETADFCESELDEVASLTAEERDPHSRATAWLEIAKVRSRLGNRLGAIGAVGRAHRDGWGPAQHQDDYQLVTWLEWLIDSVGFGGIDQATFLNEACIYAGRLVLAAEGADRQVSDAAGDLVTAVFGYDSGLAIDMGEVLCARGVFSEEQLTLSIVKAAAVRPDVDPGLVNFVLTELLMPMNTASANSIETLLNGRSGKDADLSVRFNDAKELWFAPESRKLTDIAEPIPSMTVQESEIESQLQLPTVLGQMRRKQPGTATLEEISRWSRAINSFCGTVQRRVGVELLGQAERLKLEPSIVAAIAGLASRAGAVEESRSSLSRLLAHTKPYGWIRNYDGGSRVTLFEAAIQHHDDDLVDLAARDLAGLIASEAIGGNFDPRDLRRFAQLFGGSELVALCWSEVQTYLDVFAPAQDILPELSRRVSEEPNEEILKWAGLQLGHPVRIMDFGARRVLASAHVTHPAVVEKLLAKMLGQDGWTAEAALHVLLEIDRRVELVLSPYLATLLVRATSDCDAVVRILARRLAAFKQLEMPVLAPTGLPVIYNLNLPPLWARNVPELDMQGVPYVDMTDPQQVTAPFDQHLGDVADTISLDAAVLIHRAAALGHESLNRWTEGGHRAHAARLKARGNFHTYRPWAYMVGRRGCAQVLAELMDARALPDGQNSIFLELMLDEALNWLTPLPLDKTTPMPWRAIGSKDYPTEAWCTEAFGAAEFYASEFSNNNILAERSRWRWLAWGVPEEERWIRSHHGQWADSLFMTPAPNIAWESTNDVASSYPNLRDLTWSHNELVVQGHSYFSDPEHFEWIAVHPAVANELGWRSGGQKFEWVGADGAWRARSVHRVRGQMSQRPPSDAVCAEVWQVVLSGQGWAEVALAFPGLQRTVFVSRILPESKREGRERHSSFGRTTIYDELA